MASVDPWRFRLCAACKAEDRKKPAGDGCRCKVTEWRARWRTPEGESRSKVFDRKRDADAHKAGIEAAKHRGAYVDPAGGRMRFGELAEAWAEVQDWKDSTRQGWPQTVKRLKPLWKLRLDEVDRLAFETLRADLAKRYTRRVVENTMLRALAIGRYAFECGKVGRDPTIGVDAAPKRRADDPPERVMPEMVPTRAEALAILTAMATEWRAFWALGLAGLRIGETLGMAEDRIALDRREVTVDQQAQPLKGRGMVLTTPKAERCRTIKVPGLVAVELRRHLREHPGGMLFPGNSNGLMRPATFYAEAWYPTLATAGLGLEAPEGADEDENPPEGPGRFVYHAGRHFCASMLLAEGAPVTAVAGHLGDTVQTVVNTYAHWLRDDRDVPADVLDRVLAPAAVSPLCHDRAAEGL